MHCRAWLFREQRLHSDSQNQQDNQLAWQRFPPAPGQWRTKGILRLKCHSQKRARGVQAPRVTRATQRSLRCLAVGTCVGMSFCKKGKLKKNCTRGDTGKGNEVSLDTPLEVCVFRGIIISSVPRLHTHRRGWQYPQAVNLCVGGFVLPQSGIPNSNPPSVSPRTHNSYWLSAPTPRKGRWTLHPQQTGLAGKGKASKKYAPHQPHDSASAICFGTRKSGRWGDGGKQDLKVNLQV